MNYKLLFPLLLAFVCTLAFAAQGSIAISSPANGALVPVGSKLSVSYEAMLGAKGDHLHLYVDGTRVEVLRQLKGSSSFDVMAPGKHKICLTENTKWHIATGMESCVEVIAQ